MRIILKAALVMGVLVLGAGLTLADQAPAGCNANNLNLNISREKAAIINGDDNTYTVTATNNVGLSDGCDIEAAEVIFFCPAPDGSPTGASSVLSPVGGSDLPANPVAGTVIMYTPVVCTINANPGVTNVTVRAAAGDRFNDPPSDQTRGILHDISNDNAFLIDKLLGTEVQECVVEVDKQVSCDGGLTWLDDNGTVSANEDGTNVPCAGWNEFPLSPGNTMPAEPIMVRYLVANTGTAALFQCDLTESNPLIDDAGPAAFDLLAGENTGFMMDNNQTCSAELAAGEPDNAMVACFCTAELDPSNKASASDQADFDCQTPGLEVIKTCADADTSGDNAVEISVTNTGTAVLENCTVEDNLYEGDPLCPADIGLGTPVALSQDFIGTLNPGNSVDITGSVSVSSTAANLARVVCEVAGTDGKTITAESCDECENEGEGCFTRTPGFWGTHPDVAALYLDVDSCGITMNAVTDQTPNSTTEDMCRNARDAKANDTSPQQLQLIRQCTAAALNVAATASFGGSCEDFGITALLAECCDGVCTVGATGQAISATECIERVDAFNNLPDTIVPDGFPWLPSLGANGFNAKPTECRQSNGNGWVNPGRNLGPRD